MSATQETVTVAFQKMIPAVRHAGVVARMMQGKVANEGKDDPTALPNDDDALRARRAAKTVVDEIVQEILLEAASSIYTPSTIALDAEEHTSAVARFRSPGDTPMTLVLDPVDGTIDYLHGRDSYSICVGLVEGGVMRMCIVYFPARDVLYALDAAGAPFVQVGGETGNKASSVVAGWPHAESRTVYKNGRVPVDVVRRLAAAGFEVLDDTDGDIGAADALLACLRGEAAAYISHTRQMRDILIGPIVGALPGGFATDWSGHELIWPVGGRVPRAIFGCASQARVDVLRCLAA